LVWVAFLIQGLWRLQVAVEKGIRRVGSGWQGLERASLLLTILFCKVKFALRPDFSTRKSKS
jgi:hypothetical protein